jgi:hypothetical protein
MQNVMTGGKFGLMMCDVLGLNPKQVTEILINNELDSIFSAKVTIALTKENLIQLGQLAADVDFDASASAAGPVRKYLVYYGY